MNDIAASSDLAPALPRSAPARSGGAGLGSVLDGARNFLSQPAVAKSIPALGFLALLGIGVMVWMAMSAAPGRALFANLPEADKSAVVQALQAANMPYTIDRDTGTINVSEDNYYQARMLLAGQGLPRGGPSADDMISSMPLGASRAVEGERLRGAREMDLARTIEAIDAVQTARVHIATATPSVFVRDDARGAASVMLTLQGGRTLGDAQVQAIVNLVASSVPGLTPDNVSVVDQNGRLLSRQGGTGSAGESERQVAVQAMIEERYRQSLATLLTPILGQGNFTAEVHADVDFAEVQSTREGFPQDGRVVAREEGAVTTDGAGQGAAGGIPGALSDTPPPPATTSATASPAVTPATPGATDAAATTEAGGRRSENYNRSYAVGREVSVTRQPTGTVRRVSVGIALRNPTSGRPRSRAELQQIEQLVKGAIGFDQARGDVVALSARDFVSADAAAADAQAWYEAPWMSGLARNITALAIAALLIFGLGRPLLRKGSAVLAQRAEAHRTVRTRVGGEIAAAVADQAKVDTATKVTLEMIEATADYEARAALIRGFVRQDPARAALVVRDLIRADTRTGA